MHKARLRWVAQMGPVNFGGKVTMRVVATDKRGNTATGPRAQSKPRPCPG